MLCVLGAKAELSSRKARKERKGTSAFRLFSINLLYRNNGDGTFKDAAPGAGVAFSEDGREQAGMGAELEDLNNDGWLDLFVTNFSEDWNTLRLNQKNGLFDDVSVASGIGKIQCAT